MKINNKTAIFTYASWARPALLASVMALGLSACVDLKEDEETKGADHSAIKTSMDLPDSMTGGNSGTSNARTIALSTHTASDKPCFYDHKEHEDPFRNGFKMTRFMVSAVATWSCVTDTVIEIVDFVPHDGVIYPTEHDASAEDFDRDEPTHYSVTDDSDTQTTVRLYYGYLRDNPPTENDDPSFFVSWDKTSETDLSGRLVIDALGIHSNRENHEDPVQMRMDFVHSENQKLAEMFIRFDDGNAWADGLRIEVTEDLLANPLNEVFLARGLMAMKAQFRPADGIEELPLLRMYTVSDQLGEGAAIAEFVNASLPLLMNENTGNHLGNYIFDKTDIYFFDADQSAENAWDYIYKTVTGGEYRGGRTTPETGGTWIPFDPSLDMIKTALVLDESYFTGSACANVGDDCIDLMNAIFMDGFAFQEPNQGEDPLDWRSDAIAEPVYLDTVFPNGLNWDGAFDPVYNPIKL